MKEADRLRVIHGVINGGVRWREAAEELGLSMRQVGYLCAQVRSEGNEGIRHHLRGRPSNNQLAEGIKEKALEIIEERYDDFGPTFACEKLREKHGIEISISALRRIMVKGGVWHSRKQKARHKAWRQRRSRTGMLVLLDGSIHNWFEGRGKRCVLIIFIDDATSRILYGEFVVSEDTVHLMGAARRYIERCGRPIEMYVDRDSIYKTNRQATVEEELRDMHPLTQYTRAMDELGIRMIFALSPQAKGRVERSFETHQDRLVKELRLEGINTMEAANRFLQGTYIPGHNERFALAPAEAKDAHRALMAQYKLDRIFSIRTERTVYNDWTIRYKGMYFQILPRQEVRVRPKDRVTIEIRLNGAIHLWYKGHDLSYKRLPQRPYKPYFANPSANKNYPVKPGSLYYARIMHTSL